jgi:hypothetical protein
MPFDSTPSETKPDVFSLRGFLAWVEKMPREGEYDFVDCSGGCLIHQYLKASGVANPLSNDNYLRMNDISVRDDCFGLSVACLHPRTFGAAADRARAMLAKEAM